MRFNKAMIERITGKLNKDVKTVHVCKRNDYWAIDNTDGSECYGCGLTTRECYLVLKGMLTGIQIAGVMV